MLTIRGKRHIKSIATRIILPDLLRIRDVRDVDDPKTAAKICNKGILPIRRKRHAVGKKRIILSHLLRIRDVRDVDDRKTATFIGNKGILAIRGKLHVESPVRSKIANRRRSGDVRNVDDLKTATAIGNKGILAIRGECGIIGTATRSKIPGKLRIRVVRHENRNVVISGQHRVARERSGAVVDLGTRRDRAIERDIAFARQVVDVRKTTVEGRRAREIQRQVIASGFDASGKTACVTDQFGIRWEIHHATVSLVAAGLDRATGDDGGGVRCRGQAGKRCRVTNTAGKRDRRAIGGQVVAAVNGAAEQDALRDRTEYIQAGFSRIVLRFMGHGVCCCIIRGYSHVVHIPIVIAPCGRMVSNEFDVGCI